jgi:hypothetical protein
MLVKPWRSKESVAKLHPSDACHCYGQARASDDLVENLGSVSVELSVFRLFVEKTPSGHESADCPQSVRFQSGRNADDSRIGRQAFPHFYPVSSHDIRLS